MRFLGVKVKLDRIDAEIIAALQNDARISNKELADQVGLAPSSCLERVRRLVEERVLRGFHADVDGDALGIGIEAMISVRMDHHHRDKMEAFREHALARPEVVSLYYLSGANDYLIHVVVRDTDHLRELTMDGFSSRDDVRHLETALIFDHSRRWESPNYVVDESAL